MTTRRVPILVALAAAVIALGIGLRIWILRSPLGTVNADEAVSGLMARALLDGDITTFYWQQHYGGTVELIPMAALVATLGDHAALALTPLLESVAIGWLLFVLARRRLGPTLGLATVALASIAPAAAVWFTTRAMLFYQPTLIFGLGAMVLTDLLTERVGDRNTGDESDDDTRTDDIRNDADDSSNDGDRGREDRRRLVCWAGLGLLLGLGWWTSSQIVFFAVPVVAWLVVHGAIRRPLEPAVGAAGALVGAGPWIAHNLRTSFASLRQLPGGDGGYVDHLRTQAELGWPLSFGLRRPFDERWVVGGWGWLLAIVAVAGVVAVATAFVRHRSLRCPLAGVLLTFPFVHALAPSSGYVGTGRYYVFIVPSIAYAVVAATSVLPHARRWIGVSLIAAAALTTWTLHDLRHVRLGPTGVDDLSAALEALDIDHAYTDYWTGYMLVWDDPEMAVSPDIFDRRPDWSAEVRAADSAAYVFALTSPLDIARHDDQVPRLRQHVGIVEELDIGPFRVVVPASNVPPEALPPLEAAG